MYSFKVIVVAVDGVGPSPIHLIVPLFIIIVNIMNYNNLSHIYQIERYSQLLKRDQPLHFRPFDKGKKVLKLVSLQELELTLKQMIEIVMQFMDLLLMASLSHETLQISNKVVSIKGNLFFYYVIGSTNKLGFKAIQQKDYLNQLLYFQKRVSIVKRNEQLLQSQSQKQWGEWLEYTESSRLTKQIGLYQPISSKIHFLIKTLAHTTIGQKYNSKVRILKYLLSSRISDQGMQQLVKISQKKVAKQSAQMNYHLKVKQIGQILTVLGINKLFSYQKESEYFKDQPEQKIQACSNFSVHNKFGIRVGKGTKEFCIIQNQSQKKLEEDKVDKEQLIEWAKTLIRMEIQLKFYEQQIYLIVKTLPFWKIQSKNFLQLESAMLSCQEQIIKSLLAQTRHAYLLEPSRLAFKRRTNKLEVGVSLQEQVKITSKISSMCELLLCCLDRQMLIWSTFERQLEENSRLWGEKPSQKYLMNDQCLCNKLKNGYNCYLLMRSVEGKLIKRGFSL